MKKLRTYKPDRIKLQFNRKTGDAGTIDIARGCCGCELKLAPCYSAKMAKLTNLNFFQPVHRTLDKKLLERQLDRYPLDWVRIGCISDPSLDWNKTIEVCEILRAKNKIPVVISKIHRVLKLDHIFALRDLAIVFQVSLSAFATRGKTSQRFNYLAICKKQGIDVSARINSAAFPEGTRLYKEQEKIIQAAQEKEVPILETPIRMFMTSPLWKRVDKSKYHRHLSPMSGKLDSQRTAGLIIPDAYACFSTCSPTPTKTDPTGCVHQCLTRM